LLIVEEEAHSMSEDLNLVEDEARRRAQHEQVKRHVGNEVRAEIVRDADRIASDDREKPEQVGNDLKRRAIGEVTEAESEIRRGRVFARVKQVVDFVFYVAHGMIGFRSFSGGNRCEGGSMVQAVDEHCYLSSSRPLHSSALLSFKDVGRWVQAW
jgi:hypothetical protein